MDDRIPEPVEARNYLARKAIVETEEWDDLMRGEHAHAFTVAHSRNADVLDDIFGLLNTAMAEGKSFNSFKAEMSDLMEDKGWYGRQDKTKDDKDYINWRTKLIYHVNMRTAYSAAHYRQQVRGAAMRPIWQYISKLVGDARREDHMALHEKAFRWDDPFWNENYPPNGWGCECAVFALSESEAEREGVEILKTDGNGNPPNLIDSNGNAVEWDKFAPAEWQYNPGMEALVPNFERYENLKQAGVLDSIRERYRADVNKVKLTFGEMMAITNAMRIQKPQRKDEYPQNNPILYMLGNLNSNHQKAMGINDSKIMATGFRLYHGIIEKNNDQRIPKELYNDLYELLQSPDEIYRVKKPNQPQWGDEFHLVRKVPSYSPRILNVVVRKRDMSALDIITAGLMGDDHGNNNYTRIWPSDGS